MTTIITPFAWVYKSIRKKQLENSNCFNQYWLRGIDSNYRPLGYEPNELPTAPPRDVSTYILYTDF